MPKKSKLAALRKIENMPGFVVNYLLCGPFNDDLKLTSCQAFNKNYLSSVEAKAAPKSGQYEVKNGPVWKPYAVKYDFIANLLYSYSTPGIVSYAVAYIYCPKAQSVRFGCFMRCCGARLKPPAWRKSGGGATHLQILRAKCGAGPLRSALPQDGTRPLHGPRHP